MGDRANIYVVDTAPDSTGLTHGIYLYTHWNGNAWPMWLMEALDTEVARLRWHDPAYLLRILVRELFKNLDGDDAGGGISTTLCRGEYPITVLDLVNQRVAWAEEGKHMFVDDWKNAMDFEEFVEGFDVTAYHVGQLGR